MKDSTKIGHITLQYGVSIASSMRLEEPYVEMFKNNRLSTHEIVDPVYGYQIRQMIAHILEHENPKELTYTFPTNWFQHLKQDYFPMWFINRYPVKYHVETVCIHETYPFPNVKLERDLGERVTYATIEQSPYRGGK